MWRLALGGAMTILLVTVLFFVIMGLVIGADLKESIFVGACISLSSTAVVVKCIKLDQLDHLYGLLVMQDVILGFMLVSCLFFSFFLYTEIFTNYKRRLLSRHYLNQVSKFCLQSFELLYRLLYSDLFAMLFCD